jgi:hypothetical protein
MQQRPPIVVNPDFAVGCKIWVNLAKKNGYEHIKTNRRIPLSQKERCQCTTHSMAQIHARHQQAFAFAFFYSHAYYFGESPIEIIPHRGNLRVTSCGLPASHFQLSTLNYPLQFGKPHRFNNAVATLALLQNL